MRLSIEIAGVQKGSEVVNLVMKKNLTKKVKLNKIRNDRQNSNLYFPTDKRIKD